MIMVIHTFIRYLWITGLQLCVFVVNNVWKVWYLLRLYTQYATAISVVRALFSAQHLYGAYNYSVQKIRTFNGFFGYPVFHSVNSNNNFF